MFDHIGFPVSDLEKSRSFYAAALAPLGIAVAMEFPGTVAFGKAGRPQLWLSVGGTPPAEDNPPPIRMHLAFTTANRAEVRAFHEAALAAGATDNGVPGLRLHYHPNYYGAFVFDPDGHNIEAVCHNPEG